MKHTAKLCSIILIILLILQPVYAQKKMIGMNLDMARNFYTENQILYLIDKLFEHNASYLQLHISDSPNYALESDLLGQTTSTAVLEEDRYVNPANGLPFLSFAQLKNIYDYAKEKNIELFVELGSPAHAEGIMHLYEQKMGTEVLEKIVLEENETEMDIRKSGTLLLMKNLISEVRSKALDNAKYMHIGCDEFEDEAYDAEEYIDYITELNTHIHSLGMTALLWNEGINKNNLHRIPKNMIVCYWSYDGDVITPQYKKENREHRASLPEILESGLQAIIYNSYYLYYVPNEEHRPDYAVKDLSENWNLAVWDGDNTENALTDMNGVLGACISLWSEDSIGLSQNKLLDNAVLLFEVMYNKIQ